MKSECKGGGGRKRSANGSLVHSIPKFSEVRPNEKLAEVQKMLQNRIIMKQQRQKQLQKGQNLVQKHDNGVDRQLKNKEEKEAATEVSFQPPPPSEPSSHNDSEAPPQMLDRSGSGRRRKPAKDEICRRPVVVEGESSQASKTPTSSVKAPTSAMSNTEATTTITAATTTASTVSPLPLLPGIPHLSEVTITPVTVDRKRKIQELDKALDLAKKKETVEEEEVLEVTEEELEERKPKPKKPKTPLVLSAR